MTESPSEVVAQRLKQLRRARGWSAQRLAEECARLGAPHLSASVIANIETGRKDSAGKRRREVTVEELLIFSYALNAPTVALLVPFTSEQMQITPNVTASPDAALGWLLGGEPLLLPDGTVRDRETWSKHEVAIRQYRHVWSIFDEIYELWGLIDESTTPPAPDDLGDDQAAELEAFRHNLEERVHVLARSLLGLRDGDLPLPAVPTRLLRDLDRLGYLPPLGLQANAGGDDGK